MAIIALDKENPKKLESYLLEMYVNKFGELPPLNGQYGEYHLDKVKSILSDSELSMFYSAKG